MSDDPKPTRPRRTTKGDGTPLLPYQQREVDESIERLEASPPLTRYGAPRMRAFRKTTGLGMRDDDTADKFLERYTCHGGIYRACAEAGVSYDSYKKRFGEDEDFNAACKLALGLFRDSLETEAVRRARDGVPEPVIGGKDRDEIVTHVQKYSDGLLVRLLQRHIPEFRDKIELDAKVSGGAMVVPPLVSSPDEWVKLWGTHARKVHDEIEAENAARDADNS